MAAIIALDIATTTGWAILDSRSPDRPYIGTIPLPRDPQEIGRSAEALRLFLADRHKMHGGFSHFVFEAQHVAGKRKTRQDDGSFVETGGMNIYTLRRLIGLAAMAEWFAFKVDAKCFDVSISSWRKHAFGNGRMKRAEAKERAMEECRALGFDPSNDNEAEAFFILDYYIAMRNKHGAAIPTPWRDNAFFDRSGAIR